MYSSCRVGLLRGIQKYKAAVPFSAANPIPSRTVLLRTLGRYSRSWEVTAKMRTITEVQKEAVPSSVQYERLSQSPGTSYDFRLGLHYGTVDSSGQVVKHNQSRTKKSPEISDHGAKQKQGRAEGERLLRSVSQETNNSGRDATVDIIALREQILSNNVATLPESSENHRNAGESIPLIPESRRAFPEDGVGSPPIRHHSFRDDVGRAASETFLITRLSFNLLRYLGLGYRWITKFLALGLYALFLMPGFIQVGYKYFFSRHVHRSIVYGDQPRNRLDLYLPESTGTPKPVFIFVTGGAWIIGYKAWGALLGLQLLERDIIVCCVDYRNFPQGRVSDMVRDVSTGIGFIVNNITVYGGDPERIHLGGQSAGAHLAACALLDQARMEVTAKEGMLTWRASQIKTFLGLSGGYNLTKLVDHFHNRGLYRSIFLSIMEGEESLAMYSPELVVRSDVFADAVRFLPKIYLFHGTGDYSIPHDASANFADALHSAGATVLPRFYANKTHTDVFIQDPMRGGPDPLFQDLLNVIHEGDEEALAKDARSALRPRLVPEFLLQLARKVSPF